MGRRRIGIIGGGFSGTALAVHLLRALAEPADIFLFDRSPAFGRGLAYATHNPKHLLNVRAAHMSAFEDDPGHFERWLAARRGACGGERTSGQTFATRADYGTYLAEVLREARRGAAGSIALHPITAMVSALAPIQGGNGGGIALTVPGHGVITVDQAVLCLGNHQPGLPIRYRAGLGNDASFIADPWDGAALGRIKPDDAVLLLGSGLTMIDVAIQLATQGHRAPIAALSRHGLLPQVHGAMRPYPAFVDRARIPPTVLGQLRLVRTEVRRARAAGIDWRIVIDCLRPIIQDFWRVLPRTERRRFLRHLRPYWEIHRHRLAPAIAAEVTRLIESGQLTVSAGRLIDADFTDRGAMVFVLPRGAQMGTTLQVDWLINCSGPEGNYARVEQPLIRDLLDRGLARADELSLGLDVAADFTVIDAKGDAQPRLFALGPPTRGAVWEITAVPDIRRQCASVSATLARCPSPA